MSCWIVSQKHIDVLALLIDSDVPDMVRLGGFGETDTVARRTAIGQALIAENTRSHSYRYDGRYDAEHPNPADYVWENPRLGQELENPYYVLKQIDCYDYQACEHPEWDTCWVKQALDRLRRHILDRMPEHPWIGKTSRHFGDPATYDDTPEYDAAPWGI